MGHSVQGLIGLRPFLDRIHARFSVSRVIPLVQELAMLPMIDDLYDALPAADHSNVSGAAFHFRYLDSRLMAFLVEASRDEMIVYFETDYFGGLGDQGVIAVRSGNTVLGPKNGEGAINAALKMLGVKKGSARDEFDAIGLGRFRHTPDWLEGAT